jgi:di/tricarboxylate transporter
MIGLGKLSSPGPGFMPFWVGVIIACLACYKLLKESLLKREEADAVARSVEKAKKKSFMGKLILIILVLLAYALFLESLGYIIVTFLVMMFLLRFAGFTQWAKIAAYSAIIVGVSYSLFQYLGVRFPAGLLEHFGLY